MRTWPLREADQIVSLFTRDQGKIKGVAKAAMKSRRRFGGALEPMTHVLASYAENPKQELVRLDSFEIMSSPLSQPIDYVRAAVLALYSEVLEDTLPDHDPQEAVFRLLLAVLQYTQVAQPWMPLTYFALWVTRLMGWLPNLSRCVVCGLPLAGAAAFFEAQANGLFCVAHRRGGYNLLSADSHALALRVFRSPISGLAPELWPRSRAVDLRHFALESLERNMERKLTTASVLARLGG